MLEEAAPPHSQPTPLGLRPMATNTHAPTRCQRRPQAARWQLIKTGGDSLNRLCRHRHLAVVPERVHAMVLAGTLLQPGAVEHLDLAAPINNHTGQL